MGMEFGRQVKMLCNLKPIQGMQTTLKEIASLARGTDNILLSSACKKQSFLLEDKHCRTVSLCLEFQMDRKSSLLTLGFFVFLAWSYAVTT